MGVAFRGVAAEKKGAPGAKRRRWRPGTATVVSIAAHMILAGTFLELSQGGGGEASRQARDAVASEPSFHVSLLRYSQPAAPAAPAPAAPARAAKALVVHAPGPSAPPSPATDPSPLASAATAHAETPAQGVVGGASAQAASPAQAQRQSDFRQRLYDHIERFVLYPNDARGDGVFGTAEVLFRMDRTGKVLGVWLKRSSGFAALDAAAVAAIWRAQPLPVIPAELPDTLSVAAPVAFTPAVQGRQG